VALLSQELFRQYMGVELPLSAILWSLNAVPAIISFRIIGKQFTLYSLLMVVLVGLFTDVMPVAFAAVPGGLELLAAFRYMGDPLLSAVFGGLLAGVSIILCLLAGATSGGTDFIAIAVSEKYNKDTWNYILAANLVVLTVAAFTISLQSALYSIILQFTMTMVLNTMYRGYQQQTMLIVTARPREVYELIREKTNHAATSLSGTGLYGNEEKAVLYSVVYSNEVAPLIRAIRATDADAFINVVKTEQINGKFYRKPKD